MRARILLPLIVVLMPALAAAQGRAGAGRRAAQPVIPQMMQRGFGAGVEGGPAQRLLDRKDELGLTADQVTRLEALAGEWKTAHEQLSGQMQELRENRAQLTEAQREQARALREQAQAAGEKARTGIESLLTAEQRQKLGDRLGMMGGGRQGAMRGGRQGTMRGGRGGAAVGQGARGRIGGFGPAQRPGMGPGRQAVAPMARRAPAGQAWAPRAAAPLMRTPRFLGGGSFGPGQPAGARAQMMQRRAPVPALPVQPLRRRWMEPDTAF